MNHLNQVHQGCVIDGIFQPTDQVLSAEIQESANLLVILGSQSTEPSFTNHFDGLCDVPTGQGDAKAATFLPGGKDAEMTDEQQSGDAHTISTKATATVGMQDC